MRLCPAVERAYAGTTLSSRQGRLGMPPKAARTAGPPRTPLHSPRGGHRAPPGSVGGCCHMLGNRVETAQFVEAAAEDPLHDAGLCSGQYRCTPRRSSTRMVSVSSRTMVTGWAEDQFSGSKKYRSLDRASSRNP
jgi:hypothetical protein